jgi:hypothetical protein
VNNRLALSRLEKRITVLSVGSRLSRFSEHMLTDSEHRYSDNVTARKRCGVDRYNVGWLWNQSIIGQRHEVGGEDGQGGFAEIFTDLAQFQVQFKLFSVIVYIPLFIIRS